MDVIKQYQTLLHIREGHSLSLRNLSLINASETKCMGDRQDATVTGEFCCDCDVRAAVCRSQYIHSVLLNVFTMFSTGCGATVGRETADGRQNFPTNVRECVLALKNFSNVAVQLGVGLVHQSSLRGRAALHSAGCHGRGVHETAGRIAKLSGWACKVSQCRVGSPQGAESSGKPGLDKIYESCIAASGGPGAMNHWNLCPRLCLPTPLRSLLTTNSTPRRKRGRPCFPSP